MVKKTTLLAGFILAASLISFEALTNRNGPPGGNNGSPMSNGNTCARSGCHTGGPSVTTQTITITHDIPASGYLPNTDYNITVTASSGSASSSRIGFQASVEGEGDFAGSVSTNSNSRLSVSGPFIGHSLNGVSATGGDNSWTFVWNSEDAPDESTIYVACNFSNSNGTNSGDVIATETLTITRDPSVSITEKELAVFSITPNPAKNIVRLEGLSSEVSHLDILSLDGKLIRSTDVSIVNDGQNNIHTLDVSDLPGGNYIIVAQGALFSPQRLVVE